MITVDIQEVVANVSDLFERVVDGEAFTITEHGNPIALLLPISAMAQRRALGVDADQLLIHPDFDDLLPEFDM